MRRLKHISHLKTWLVGILAVLALAAVAVAFHSFSHQEEAALADQKEINNTGYVEAKEVTVAFKVPGKIEKILVDEGDQVKAGQPIAVLESKEIEAKVKQAQGALAMAQAKLDQAQTGESLQADVSANQIKTAEAAVMKATANLNAMTATYNRVKSLYEKGSVSAQKLDEVKAQYEAAQGMMQEAQAALNSAIAGQKQVQIREGDVQAVQGGIEQAQGAYDEAKAYLENTVLKAPCDGIVTLRTMEPGEMVNAGTPVFQITDLSNTYVEINVSEDKIGRVNLGQAAEIKVDSFPDQVFKGKVIYISDAGEFAVKKAVNEQYEHDIKTFKVKVRVPNQDLKLKVGMTAYVHIIE